MAQKFTVPISIKQLSSAGSDGLTVFVDGDTNPRLKIEAGGRLTWSSGSSSGDINLYRDSASVLATDDVFRAVSGIVTLTTSGEPSVALPNGAIAIDTTNNAFYFRSNNAWSQVTGGGGGGGATLIVSDTEPVGATEGTLWFESDTGSLFVYFDSTWIEIGGGGGSGVEAYINAKGDLLVGTAQGQVASVPVGQNGYFLKANSSACAGVEWASIPTINSLDDIGDVIASSPSDGEFLKYVSASSAWVPAAIPTINSLDDVGDVSLSTVEGGDFLVYNSSASVWVNETLHFITVSGTMPTDEVAEGNLWYDSVELELYIYNSGSWVQVTDSTLPDLGMLNDVLITDPVSGNILVYNGTEWENQQLNVTLGTNTTGNYVANISGGTGIFVTHTPGEGSSASIAIGQDVSTSSSVTFANVTSNITGNVIGDLTGNADTATTLETARAISIVGDISGSASFNGATDAVITAVIQPNSVALGTDTTGNYMLDVVGGTGVMVSHTPGEGSSASISIGQPVGTSDVVYFEGVFVGESGIGFQYNPQTGNQTRLFGANPPTSTNLIYLPDTDGTVALGQIVETSSSVTFAHVNAPLTGNVTGDLVGNADTATALETARIIELSGDVSGSASFDGTSNINISTIVNTSSVAITELYGVEITSPQNGQILEYDGTNWVNTVRPSSEPIGHEDRTDSVISFDEGSRTFSIAPVSGSYTIWCTGKRFVKTGTETVTIPDTSGLYYIYFNSSGTLAYRTSYFVWDTDTPTAYIYWNATDNKAYFFADERHGVTLDWATHEYLHRTRGAAIANGFGINNYDTGGDGSSDAHAKFDLADGTFFDEDLQVDIVHSETPTANTWEQTLQGNAEIPVFYKLGSDGHWVQDAATEFAFKQGATPRPTYNLNTGGTWSTPEVTNSYYTISWIVATNNLNNPVLAIMGQGNYSSLGNAEAATWEQLDLTGLPIVEFRPLYKVIYRGYSIYTNTVNARIHAVTDIRQIQSTAGAVPSTPVSDHGSLTGLSDDDHTQYLLADGTRAASSLTVTNDLTVNGNLTVNGTTTTLNTETLAVEDNIVVLNSGVTGSPTTNAGIEVERGTSTNVLLRWNETTDTWQFTNDGTNYTDLGAGGATISSTAPSAPTSGALWFDSDTAQTFVYYDSSWIEIGGASGGARMQVSSGAPSSPLEGIMWFDSDTAQTFVYYDGQWIEIGASAMSAAVSTVAPDSPITGQIWFNSETGATYVYYDTVWVEVGAVAQNQILQAINAKGDLIAGTADNTISRLGVGTNGQVLTANSSTATGLEWQTPTTYATTGKSIAMAIVFGGG